MEHYARNRRNIINAPFSMVVLFILLWITYGILIRAPYIGFYFNNTNGVILEVYIPDGGLTVGDELVAVGNISMTEYRADSRQTLFPADVQQGEILPITIKRNGVDAVIEWQVPGFNEREFFARFFNIWWLAYFFWVFGSLIEYFVRPRDIRWRLMVAANHLTAIWVIMGSFSTTHMWESSILLHAITWLILPVYLHLNWIFPKPLVNLPKITTLIVYLPAFAFFGAELVQALPKNLYALAFILALVGSIILQLIHFIWRPDQRRQVGFLVLSTLLAISPAIALGILRVFGEIPPIAPAALLALPFSPAAYSYLIFRSQLGGLQVRAHRVITGYAYLILIIIALFVIIAIIRPLGLTAENTALITIVLPLIASAVSIWAYPVFQAFMEQRFLGIKLPYQNLAEAYSSRITTSTSVSRLLQLLEEEVFPSLLVRQYTFIQAQDEKLKPLLTKNITEDQLPGDGELPSLVSRSGKYIPAQSSEDGWMRLILPLKVGDSHLGFWLLGERDPDDLYPQAEIPILQSIANQTAIALSNILHAEQLRKMYQTDIERNEQERMRLALELHDSVLNQIGYLRRNLNEENITPQFQSAYEELTSRLRRIVSGLRPPMLTYGLKPAIEEMTENLMERSGDNVKIHVNLDDGGERIPEHMELHLFRIAQEACENALRHADANTVRIHGSLNTHALDLSIDDDGNGFAPDVQLELDSLIADDHFGLAGMIERARLIGAEIRIRSTEGQGTSIHITWRSQE